MASLFSEPRQLGVVVRDIEKALDHYINRLGIGPWYYFDEMPMGRYAHRGKVREGGAPLTVAISHSGSMQVELIQPRHSFASSWTDFLNQGREGMHHLATYETDYDGVLARASALGFELIDDGITKRGRWAYFLHPGGANIYNEVNETTPERQKFFDSIRDAARNWDGSDPIRTKPPA